MKLAVLIMAVAGMVAALPNPVPDTSVVSFSLINPVERL